ncbi:DNA-directed RNA polymerase subunit alpha [Candidatus Sumerlaeota bacterium]|nr:DNA-directed RNA polymerase subunit alpha [Candidatus Sumerlaeota bacterium]
MNFKSLIKPRHLYFDAETLTDTFGRFYAEPFHRGFGTTIGNSLRRVLLSSIPGAAVVAIRIEGVPHEFTHKDGVREDISDVVLNLKGLRLKMAPSVNATTVYLDAKGPAKLTAKDIKWNNDVEVLNPEHPVANVSEGGRLQMEIAIETGIGYVPASEHKSDPDDIGLIPLDSAFSPILNVKFQTETTRVGQFTDYDRLIMEVTTNGAVRPDEAVSHAARVLKDHLELFIRPQDQEEEVPEAVTEDEAAVTASQLEEKLDKSIEELELSVRSYNCLEAAGIKTIRDLVQKSESEMLKYRNFGRKSLTEIKNILKEMGLGFNMRLDETGMPILSEEEV